MCDSSTSFIRDITVRPLAILLHFTFGACRIKQCLFHEFQISDILKIPSEDRTDVQKEVLQFSPDIVKRCQANKKKRDQSKSRSEEVGIIFELTHYFYMKICCVSEMRIS